MKTKWAKACANRIESQTLTENELRTMRKILRNTLNRGDNASATVDEANELLQLIDNVKPQVPYGQAERGAKYLYALAFRKDGTRRQTPAAQHFTPQDLDVVRELQIDPMFKLVVLDEHGVRGWVEHLFPVYRAIGAGRFFDYVAPSWQSGGAFYIVNRGGYPAAQP